MKTNKTLKTQKAMRALCALIAAVIFAVGFSSCDDEDESENLIFFSIRNSDGTIGSSGMSSDRWNLILDRLSNGCYIILSSDMTTEDLSTFVLCLNSSDLSNVTVDMSRMTITSISDETFKDNTKIVGVTIGNTITEIGEYAFYGCTNLATVTIGEAVESIGMYAFGHCSALTSIEIPASVTSLGSHTFDCCLSLTTAEINASCSIPHYAFYYCTALEIVTIGDS